VGAVNAVRRDALRDRPPSVANSGLIQVYWDATPATIVMWAFQGDAVAANIPGYKQQSSGNFYYLCTAAVGVVGTSTAPYVFVNLDVFDCGTPRRRICTWRSRDRHTSLRSRSPTTPLRPLLDFLIDAFNLPCCLLPNDSNLACIPSQPCVLSP
jgi:hypothetical protein